MKTRAIIMALVIAALLALLSANAVSARQSPAPAGQAQPPLVIRVGLDLIQIDAAVTDKSGRPVADLRPEDFTLEVDGKEQPITNAAWFGRSTPSKLADAEGASQDSTVVFVIDDLNVSFGSMYATRRALGVFAKEMESSRPLVALRLTSDESDQFSLYRSADRFATAARGLRYNIRSSQGVSPVATAVPASIATPMNRNRLQTLEPASALTPTEERLNLEQRAASLLSTINTLRSLPGRKAVVFVSEGFHVDSRTHDQLDRGFPFGSLFDDTDVRAALRMITEVANRASVVLYTVDPRGLMVDSPTAADQVNALQADDLSRSRWETRVGSQASLQFLADDTGGLAIANRNDLQGGFGDVLRDQGSYYLVGFEPPAKTFVKSSGRPKFHKVRLSVNRKGVRVRTRAGFYGVTDEEVIERAPLVASPE